MVFFLDRIEGDYCVFICNGQTVNIPKKLLPDAVEGDRYSFTQYTENYSKQKNEEMINKLFE